MSFELLLAALIVLPDTPFGKVEISVPEFAARDFSIADFGAREGVRATDAFAAARSAPAATRSPSGA